MCRRPISSVTKTSTRWRNERRTSHSSRCMDSPDAGSSPVPPSGVHACAGLSTMARTMWLSGGWQNTACRSMGRRYGRISASGLIAERFFTCRAAPRGGPTGWISRPQADGCQPTRRFSEPCEWSSIRVTEQPANVSDGSGAAVVASLMGRPVCLQLRKCHVHPGSYAWCQERTSRRAIVMDRLKGAAVQGHRALPSSAQVSSAG